MTALPRDSLVRQIQRGEVFYANINRTSASFEPTDTEDVVFTTSTDKCQVWFTVQTDVSISILLYEGSTHTGGSTLTQYNLNRGTAGSLGTTILESPTTIGTGGATLIANTYAQIGQNTNITPFSYDVPIILNSSTEYAYRIQNKSPVPSAVAVKILLREDF